ncbi:hypothetical protein JOC36_000661 [Weissella uvarum]|uniref:DUF4422 domain-containing protein n=1 Tax=Weissella uvarum TaxID=1479233 RepID=UPI00195F9C70|nr:DUF4422 domain-containing protein [Weissella uvarum]MBM7617112.1 hypothetical protein [Weissella uvarum]MCM0595408.1 DUF4422 domain-containing protein [Weissella uvarum]
MKIIVAAHKPYQMPKSDIYLPVYVGSALKDDMPAGYVGDDTGQNISEMNPYYNELTALYWAKYNLQDEDVLGLAHYRRYLGRKSSHDLADVLSESDINSALAEVDVLLPKHRNYVIDNQRDHYLNAHLNEPFFVLEKVIELDYPSYLPAFRRMEASSKIHLYNMSIMKQGHFQSYTDFLFGVLEKVQAQIPYQDYQGQDARVFGFLAERLKDVWLETNQLTYREFPLVTTEKTNWIDKGTQFLKRKFLKNQPAKTHF